MSCFAAGIPGRRRTQGCCRCIKSQVLRNPPAAGFNIPLSFVKLGIVCGTQEYLASIHIKHLDDSQVYYEATIEWKGVSDTEKQSSDVSVGTPGRSQRLGLSLHFSSKQRFSRKHPGQVDIRSCEMTVNQMSFGPLCASTRGTSHGHVQPMNTCMQSRVDASKQSCRVLWSL